MRILLTNDDGYHARGLAVLERIARTLSDDITVVAPAEEQSGKGRSLTLTEPFRVRRHGEGRYAVKGTPTDCVMFALGEVMADAKPDLILSGVNRGGNLAEDVSYSGTVSAAMEGALAGIRSIALSQRYARSGMGDAVPFDTAETWGERVLRPLLDVAMEPRTLVNINFPPIAADAVQGIKVVSQGFRDYGRVALDKRLDPRGFPYYWLAMGRMPHQAAPDTDLDAIEAGFVTVTPLHLDLTHRESMDRLRGAYAG
ncbi:5'/3'-nucleotidase SurE [Sphingomonas sp. ABOLD]|uniref:5'-nucleotidase SurE n=1 Tax=Sphingomonas trueperi TaxID=53317 RepID=A0A7X5XZ04_9SPHN|nr:MULTISPECIES: 5'/3'-nucleotidase SurE [Sphingomonas]NJB97573.1 5'-nucleotidase [Sphingomonas trueperi]RSV43131.1 5'/3'-nucleotidase SurE [Sphingomonas sp. ABOLE]RSV50011.1 5'/3'-nucleotidase SurE [Sphingomonas sp. ABOLD]